MADKTKQANCITCGKDIDIHIYASAKKAQCDNCKEGAAAAVEEGTMVPPATDIEAPDIEASDIEASDIEAPENGVTVTVPAHNGVYDTDKRIGPRIDGAPNRALAKLSCPHHPDKQMTVIGVIKGDWGDIVSLQCRVPKCWTVVNISEQSAKIGPLMTRAHGDGYEVDPSVDTDSLTIHLQEGSLATWKAEHQD